MSSCVNNWSAANWQFREHYELQAGQVYELTRPAYIFSHGVAYVVPNEAGLRHVTLSPGTRFSAISLEERGSHNNGYFYSPIGKVMAPDSRQGLLFKFDRLLVDNHGDIRSPIAVRVCLGRNRDGSG